MAKASRGDDQYMLRFPEGLRERVKSAAETNARSMNSEIIERIEGYEMIQWKMSQLVEEKEKLSAQLDATRDALTEQRKISDQLQHLLSEGFEKAKQEQETEGVIEKRFNELKAQSDYLEALKTELLELSKDGEAKRLAALEIQDEQRRLLDRMGKTERSSTEALKALRTVFSKAADGDDEELKKIVSAFQILDEPDE